ncbi:MAG: hypothetical protein KVP17_000832 [Porospora cf. gigantea B]|uniref:uncharacterized protein n=1 Tax=Porospora cf. gigantea B TaxID=2853592 RepID=UPI0035718F1A|nr:MAG: hypothetical protein KVP17_000832 [Porospora cf. gigantea B]
MHRDRLFVIQPTVPVEQVEPLMVERQSSVIVGEKRRTPSTTTPASLSAYSVVDADRQLRHSSYTTESPPRGSPVRLNTLLPAYLIGSRLLGESTPVSINVYRIAFGLYHSSLAVGSVEYHFWDGTGVKCHERFSFRGTNIAIDHLPHVEEISVGWLRKKPLEVDHWIWKISQDFSAFSYDLLTHNCNHFVARGIKALGFEFSMPAWINRAAVGANWLCYVVPHLRKYLVEGLQGDKVACPT